MTINLEKILSEEGAMGKYKGVAPEGFVLVHEKTIQDLKNFETWREWKNNGISINQLNNKNVNLDENEQSKI